jgi:poly-beta-1,6-N-acetyl-D-glucosamine synthase
LCSVDPLVSDAACSHGTGPGTGVAPATAPTAVPTAAATPPTDPGPVHRRFYLPVTVKFLLSLVFAAIWVGVSTWVSMPWIDELTRVAGSFIAWLIVVLVAYLPGFIVALMMMSLLLDRQPPLNVANPTTAVTVIIAARNEQAGIAETIRCLGQGDYAGPITVILADNGSTDDTCAVARHAADMFGVDLRIVTEALPGKSHALNTALDLVTTSYVVTVDADTLLHPQALRRLVSRLESAPADTVAVAGAVLVRNSRTNLLTSMQEWDYYLGIAGVKRMQGLYQSTLVAQGAFSLYLTDRVRHVGGWPDAIGEDIVVTWRLMQGGERVLFEPTSVAFTGAPIRVGHFMRQRARWARGMFEGLRAVPPWRQPRVLTKFIAGIDLFIPLLDVGYALIWLPGLVLFLLGVPLIVSIWTLLVLPVTIVVYGMLRIFQSRRVFRPLGLTLRRNWFGYIAFLLLYQSLCSIAAIAGYAQYAAGTRRRWK